MILWFRRLLLIWTCWNSDQWADLVQDRRWSWNGLLPYFKRVETWYPSVEMKKRGLLAIDSHGDRGPIKVAIALYWHEEPY